MDYDDVLNAKDPGWIKDARKLMEAGKRFVVVEWRAALDGDASYALAKEFGYICVPDTDPNLPHRAYFRPGNDLRFAGDLTAKQIVQSC